MYLLREVTLTKRIISLMVYAIFVPRSKSLAHTIRLAKDKQQVVLSLGRFTQSPNHLHRYGNATRQSVLCPVVLTQWRWGEYPCTGGLKELTKRTNWQRKGSKLLSKVQSQWVRLDGIGPKYLCRTGSKESINADGVSFLIKP